MGENEGKRRKRSAPIRVRASLDVGNWLGDTFKVLLANLVPFCFLAILIFLPQRYWLYRVTGELLNGTGSFFMAYAANGVGWVLQSVYTIFVVYGTLQYLGGNRPSFNQVLVKGFSRALPAMLIRIVSGLIIIVGFILLIIPGFIFVTIFFVVVPIVVMEKLGVENSLRRSADLTRGSRWLIFAVWFGLTIGFLIINRVVEFTIVGLAPSLDSTSYLGGFILQNAISLLSQIINAVLAATAYFHLRRLHEGTNVGELAEVFS